MVKKKIGRTTKDCIIEALKRVEDPEIGIDLWTLGLIYKIDEQEGRAKITMTLTTPLCPFGPMLVGKVKEEVQNVKGITAVDVELTFDPPWEPKPELRTMLGV